MTKLWGILQVRMKSARLPGKALLPVLDRPILVFNIERLLRAKSLAGLVVATSVDPADDPIEDTCAAIGVPVFRGSEDDVLDRIYQCAAEHRWTAFAKFTADNPLIDPAVVDHVAGAFVADPDAYDYVSNNHPPTWQDGQEVEVIRTESLRQAWTEGHRPFQREHVTPFIWDQPDRYRLLNVARADDRWYHAYRWTLDYPEDYAFVRAVFEALYPANPAFNTAALMKLLDERRDIHAINASRAGYSWYDAHKPNLQTIEGQPDGG